MDNKIWTIIITCFLNKKPTTLLRFNLLTGFIVIGVANISILNLWAYWVSLQ